MSHYGTSAFDNHFDYRLIVLKNMQHGTSTRMHCVGWDVVNVSWNDAGALELDGVVRVGLGSLQRVSFGALCWVVQSCSVRNEILQSPNPRDRVRIQSMREPASREITSASAELCETEVCFLHVQLIGQTCDSRK